MADKATTALGLVAAFGVGLLMLSTTAVAGGVWIGLEREAARVRAQQALPAAPAPTVDGVHVGYTGGMHAATWLAAPAPEAADTAPEPEAAPVVAATAQTRSRGAARPSSAQSAPKRAGGTNTASAARSSPPSAPADDGDDELDFSDLDLDMGDLGAPRPAAEPEPETKSERRARRKRR